MNAFGGASILIEGNEDSQINENILTRIVKRQLIRWLLECLRFLGNLLL